MPDFFGLSYDEADVLFYPFDEEDFESADYKTIEINNETILPLNRYATEAEVNANIKKFIELKETENG